MDSGPRTGRVLVVDDEHTIADSLVMILKISGYESAAAYDADSAWKFAQSFEPNALIADVVMPGTSGTELAVRIAQTFPACKILLCSGQATIGIKLISEAGAKGYDFELLQKPIHPSEILRRLRE